MRKQISKIIVIILVGVVFKTAHSSTKGFDFSSYKLDAPTSYHVPTEEEAFQSSIEYRPFSIFLSKGFIGFKEALAFKESQGKYHVVNPLGYMGKYQFGKGTLAMIGVDDTTDFLSDSALQEAAFTANTARNKWILRRDIERFVGKVVNGIKVTESGILAAAHLAGAGNVKKYLRSYGSDMFSDANGTTISYYLKRFSGYDTSFVIADKKAKVSFF